MPDSKEKEARVISASRRTDIPAFFTNWFLEALETGSVSFREPFSDRMRTISMKPEDVHSIVFWSRDYSKLIPHLRSIEAKGYSFYFHFTITGHSAVFDRRSIPADDGIGQLVELSRLYSPDHVQWRFDPLIISEMTDARYLVERFASIAQRLKGSTRRCYISFAQFYGKVKKSLHKLEQETGVRCLDPPVEEKLPIARKIAEIAAENGMRVFSCCCDYLVSGQIEKAHCIDGELLRQLFPEKPLYGKAKPTRKGCGCFESQDIGTYNTCSHGCIYCYANSHPYSSPLQL